MIVAIIQARVASTRLPGKVRRYIQGKPMLQRVVERAQRILQVDHVVVATSWDPLDDWIVSQCRGYKDSPMCFRGEHRDVLGRYEMVAREMKLSQNDQIIRLTADCPLLDPLVSGRVLTLHTASKVDYASNLRDWPDGLDTEVFTRAALGDAAHMASSDEDREHVTPWMRRNVFCVELPHTPPLRHLKWSVDTEEELEYVREVYVGVGEAVTWEDILTLKPEHVCQRCREGVPHAQRALGSIGGPRDYTVWDLHETNVAGGVGTEECQAWAICHRKGDTLGDVRARGGER